MSDDKNTPAGDGAETERRDAVTAEGGKNARRDGDGVGDGISTAEPKPGQGIGEPGSDLPDVPRIRLRAPSGVVIDYTLPLHESIDGQWRRGELQRVDDDEQPFEGDEYDLSAAYGQPGDREDADSEDEDDGNHALAGGPGQFERADGINGHRGPVTAEVATAGTQQPERPADNAPKKVWQDYAVAIGACDADEAAGLTRQQLQDKATPPELRPGVQPA